jgi:two-component system, chemotaxis family, sensor kinase CheA
MAMDDLLEEFIAETRETLEILSSQLVQWERSPADRSLVDSVFRFVHTVKGSCGFLNLPRLLKLSHAAEDLMSAAREGQITPTADLVTAVLAVIDKIGDITNALESGQSIIDNDESLIAAMLGFVSDRQDTNPQTTSILERHTPEMAIDTKSRSVRVSLGLLDTLMNGISDMVLARNEVSRQMRKHGTNTELDFAFGKLSSSVAEIRDAIGLMRMQHIDRLFSSLPRQMRDICHGLGKEIDLTIIGSEVEVDREMVEALRDPLVHILRNAADHGIETADERRALGKPEIGKIQIGARQSGNQILIEISDDGRGIDVEKLSAKALSTKLYTETEWKALSATAKLETIFIPGFSTSNGVSAISGRGVGMDVVRNNLQIIGGTIDLDNKLGVGLTMTLRLPLTLSIITGISVRGGNQIFGLARSSVVEILSESNANFKIENLGGRKIACVRGQRLPYGRIEEILNIEDISTESSRIIIVINPAVGGRFVLDVAAVIDNEELVIKPGAPIIMATGLYSGTSLPDNGQPMLLLDASGLAAEIGVVEEQHSNSMINASNDDEHSAKKAEESLILFIALDGVQRAIRMSNVDRIEKISSSDISFVGGKVRANVEGQLTDIFDISLGSISQSVSALRITDGEIFKYLAVEDVIDVVSITSNIVPSAYPDKHEGLIQVDGVIVEILNVFQFFELDDSNAHRAGNRPLCYVQCNEHDHWERRILQPLLAASGYQVSFDKSDQTAAHIIIGRDDSDDSDDNSAVFDRRVLKLRNDSYTSHTGQPSIYRYDRIGLMSAIQAKLSGVS